jgi:hypothetical protein
MVLNLEELSRVIHTFPTNKTFLTLNRQDAYLLDIEGPFEPRASLFKPLLRHGLTFYLTAKVIGTLSLLSKRLA